MLGIKAWLLLAAVLLITNAIVMLDAHSRIECLKQTQGKEERC